MDSVLTGFKDDFALVLLDKPWRSRRWNARGVRSQDSGAFKQERTTGSG